LHVLAPAAKVGLVYLGIYVILWLLVVVFRW
jgi:hypothetical protein